MRPINLIVIHCSATPSGDTLFRGRVGDADFQTPLTAIDSWHRQRGFRRDPAARAIFNPDLGAIGYHYVIYRAGVVVTGRGEAEIGAHAQGHNARSLGICLVGIDAYTPAQWESLRTLVNGLLARYPLARVVGHRDLSPDIDGDGTVERHEWLKTCPGFDVGAWFASGMRPPLES